VREGERGEGERESGNTGERKRERATPQHIQDGSSPERVQPVLEPAHTHTCTHTHAHTHMHTHTLCIHFSVFVLYSRQWTQRLRDFARMRMQGRGGRGTGEGSRTWVHVCVHKNECQARTHTYTHTTSHTNWFKHLTHTPHTHHTHTPPNTPAIHGGDQT